MAKCIECWKFLTLLDLMMWPYTHCLECRAKANKEEKAFDLQNGKR